MRHRFALLVVMSFSLTFTLFGCASAGNPNNGGGPDAANIMHPDAAAHADAPTFVDGPVVPPPDAHPPHVDAWMPPPVDAFVPPADGGGAGTCMTDAECGAGMCCFPGMGFPGSMCVAGTSIPGFGCFPM